MKSMTPTEAKEAAIRLWTKDPCGHDPANGEPGTPGYVHRLLAARRLYAPWMAEELDYAATRGKRVLDVGCGQGIDVVEYAFAGAEVVGIDLTPRHVELARKHLTLMGLEGMVTRADAESLPFADDVFDQVSSNGVLHHTPDMGAALREMHRVTKPGGAAVIVVYNRSSLHYWLDQVILNGLLRRRLITRGDMLGVLATSVEQSGAGEAVFVRACTPRRLKRLVEEAGFTDVTVVRRHFRPEDTFVTAALVRHGFAFLGDACVRRSLGALVGWYLVAHGRAAPRPARLL
jgi:ubiquinone/menaquinone biosynthesis C-methylase UbiE